MMESFFDFIFANLFLVFVIITGLLSFFNRMISGRSKNKEEHPSSDQPKKSTIGEAMRRMQEMIETIEQPDEPTRQKVEKKVAKASEKLQTARQKIESSSYSFEEMRNEQFDRLKQQYESSATHNDWEGNPNTLQKRAGDIKAGEIHSITPIEVNLQSRLNKEGLIESIVMAEILGPPRARKRFGTRFVDR